MPKRGRMYDVNTKINADEHSNNNKLPPNRNIICCITNFVVKSVVSIFNIVVFSVKMGHTPRVR
jgi:hypothetical protein